MRGRHCRSCPECIGCSLGIAEDPEYTCLECGDEISYPWDGKMLCEECREDGG